MVEILQQRHKEVIVLCKNGNFYIAVGKDARALNKKIGLKLTCMGPELCKAGFPVSAFEKYTKLLWDKKCNYTIYDFNNEKEELIPIQSYLGGHDMKKKQETSATCVKIIDIKTKRWINI